jgi:hypothetical protein
MNVTDTWKLANYHGIINWSKKEDHTRMSIQRFAGVLGKQLLTIARAAPQTGRLSFAAPAPSRFSPSQDDPSIVVTGSRSTNLSSLSDQEDKVVIPIRTLVDVNGEQHHQVAFPMGQQANGKRCTKTRACKLCLSQGKRRLVRHYCFTCGLSSAFCCPPQDRDCFQEHVSKISLAPRERRNVSV